MKIIEIDGFKTTIKMLITFIDHANLETFQKATGTALIAVSPVNEAASQGLCFAEVMAFTADGTLEETGTAITSEDAVVFS